MHTVLSPSCGNPNISRNCSFLYNQSRLRASILPIDYCVALSLCYACNKLCQITQFWGNRVAATHTPQSWERAIFSHDHLSAFYCGLMGDVSSNLSCGNTWFPVDCSLRSLWILEEMESCWKKWAPGEDWQFTAHPSVLLFSLCLPPWKALSSGAVSQNKPSP